MTALTARIVALADQILAILADEAPLPVSTMEVWRKARSGPDPESRDWREVLDEVIAARCDRCDRSDLPVGYPDVIRCLNRLARLGEVEKIRLEDMRCLYWRRWQ